MRAEDTELEKLAGTSASLKQQGERNTISLISLLLTVLPFFIPCHFIFIRLMRIKLAPKYSRQGRKVKGEIRAHGRQRMGSREVTITSVVSDMYRNCGKLHLK